MAKILAQMIEAVETGDEVVVERFFTVDDRKWIKHHHPLIHAWLDRIGDDLETLDDATEALDFALATAYHLAAGADAMGELGRPVQPAGDDEGEDAEDDADDAEVAKDQREDAKGRS